MHCYNDLLSVRQEDDRNKLPDILRVEYDNAVERYFHECLFAFHPQGRLDNCREIEGARSANGSVSVCEIILQPPEENEANNDLDLSVTVVPKITDFYVVEKRASRKSADDLKREFEAGQFINHLRQYHVNFVHTYALGTIDPESGVVDLHDPNDAGNEYVLWLSYLWHAGSLKHYFDLEPCAFMGVVFQVLQVLVSVKTHYPYFNHGDLHVENILVYELDEPVCLVYSDENTPPVRLRTKYVPVLIDYGRTDTDGVERATESTCDYDSLLLILESYAENKQGLQWNDDLDDSESSCDTDLAKLEALRDHLLLYHVTQSDATTDATIYVDQSLRRRARYEPPVSQATRDLRSGSAHKSE